MSDWRWGICSKAVTAIIKVTSVYIRVFIEEVKLRNIGRDIMEEKFDEEGKEEGQFPIQPA